MSTQNEENKQTEEGLIDIVGLLTDYFRTLRRMWIWVLILAVAGGTFSYIRSYMTWSPRYTASATFTITASQDGSDSTTGSYAFYDNSTAEQMANTFPYILTSGVLSRRAAETMGREAVSGQITASSEANTNLFTMSVTDSDAGLAYETLQAVIQCYPEVSEVIIGRTNMQLLDETGIPAYPDNPRDGKGALVKGAGAGALLGLLWAGAVTISRMTVKKKEDFQTRAHMKCIGEVPQVAMKKRSRESRNVLNILNEKTDPAFEEAMQLVRGKVEYSAWRHHSKTILVTSALAGEGKSTLAVNLALAFSKSGKRAALIDCDLRHPSDRKILGLEEGSGLYEVLTREARLGDVLLTGKDMEMDEEFKFCFLPGGKAAEDGSRLLGSERMQKVIEAVQEKVDYVILDSAPAGLLTDAGVLAQYADSAIFVIKRDFASTTHIMEGLEELSESRVHLIGGILNGV
ncbi:polysaccharide biosynthesis tyrosine autokinase [Mediterraneibacter glycyrrhizinilyticus]|uniref:polysaccharide biosynthesis tyrosine autokinase n=1 Tax=Mediterraneibacter glycyrrhizinilyticus TaxID=342942 RepID=UPI0025AAD8EB|nr:polysaccharide biosynthesis tyrosine autokinase [Mediterraneibacter glycyrrhizinilyticus]MDN0044582.1 AAA family ATPase [Mediterraneibacter glycyrrhizinilyticus]